MLTVLLLMSAALYGLSFLLYLVFLFGRDEGAVRLGRAALIAALVVHLGLIGWHCSHGFNPLRDLGGALSLTGLLIGVGFIVFTFRRRMSVLGVGVTMLSLSLLLASRFTPGTATPAGDPAGAYQALGRLHILLSTAGVAIFGLAAGVAVIYLLQERALKSKRLGRIFRLAPPIMALQDAGRRLILHGFPLYTLAVITGAIWSVLLHGAEARLSHVISLVTWLLYAVLIGLHFTLGMRGRRAAYLTIIGFVAMMIVLLLYGARRMIG